MDPKQDAFVRAVTRLAQDEAMRIGLDDPDMIVGGLGIVLAGMLGALAVAQPVLHPLRYAMVMDRLPGWIEWARQQTAATLSAAADAADTPSATQH